MPPNMMRGLGMGRFHHPTEILTTELIYFLIIFSLCVLILYKTRDIYKLTKHQGIFHFRNIFLFFSLAFLVRALIISIPLVTEEFSYSFPFMFGPITFLFVGYLSTMAILSLVMTLIHKKMKLSQNITFILLNVIAIISSIMVFLTRSNQILILIQTIIFLFAVVYLISKDKEGKKNFLSHNKIIYSLLFIFWLLNILASVRYMVALEYKYILYLISAGIFFSIYLRVRKRLNHHAKKKRQA